MWRRSILILIFSCHMACAAAQQNSQWGINENGYGRSGVLLCSSAMELSAAYRPIIDNKSTAFPSNSRLDSLFSMSPIKKYDDFDIILIQRSYRQKDIGKARTNLLRIIFKRVIIVQKLKKLIKKEEIISRLEGKRLEYLLAIKRISEFETNISLPQLDRIYDLAGDDLYEYSRVPMSEDEKLIRLISLAYDE